MFDVGAVKAARNVKRLLSHYGFDMVIAGREIRSHCCPERPGSPHSGSRGSAPGADFAINRETSLWHCHACGTGGDEFDFVMKMEGCEFARALELLASVYAAEPSQAASWAPTQRVQEPPFPPSGEVRQVWDACEFVYYDVAVSAYLRSRAIESAEVTDRDLARSLPESDKLPRWASHWRPAHRLVVPMYDSSGELVSLRGRSVDGSHPKAMPARGYRCHGSVMADALGRLLLSGGDVEWWTDRSVIICEGEPDFLTVATHYGDSEGAPAVFGIVSGSWTPEIATRIPSGCLVVIGTHNDDAGERYAKYIRDSIGSRCSFRRRNSISEVQ